MSAVHVCARVAVEAVLANTPAGRWIPMRVVLVAAPKLHWRALQETLRRLAAEGRVELREGNGPYGGRSRIREILLLGSAVGEAGGT
jgi:hypothetical protein